MKKIVMGLLILVMAFVLGGCAGNKAPSPQAEPAKPEYLTPIPAEKPLAESNLQLSQQIQAQKDVLGSSIYEQQGTIFGDITFKSEVDKTYAHKLINDFLIQLKVNYPGKPITTQALSDGKVFDSISFKP